MLDMINYADKTNQKNMQLQIFKFQTEHEKKISEVRTVEIDGEIWFIANEVCKILGIKNPRDAVSMLDSDEKITVVIADGNRGNPNKTVISESGLYALVFKSRKESAQKFRKWITKEVIPSIRKKGYYGKIDRSQVPNFYLRYQENFHRIDRNYFSVISELFITLNQELEKVGYQIPDRAEDGKQIMPDISVGRMFSDYLKKIDSEYNGTHKYYDHSFPDNRPDVSARMYPLEALPVFRRFVYDVWIPTKSQSYFKDRDPVALDYLPKLLE